MTALRVAAVLALVFASTAAPAATVSLGTDTDAIHVGLPFTLTLTAKGFEEDPVPVAPALEIDGCTVTYLGVSPSVSTQITISGGQHTETREVSFNFQWRVLAPSAGDYTIPSLRIEQGGVAAATTETTFEASVVQETRDMIVRMRLPQEGVFVGETFDASVEWLLARDVQGYEFTVPLFDLDGARVEPGAGTGQTLGFQVGTGEVGLPTVRDQIAFEGRQYARFTFQSRVTLSRPGVFDLEPVRVVARLERGEAVDRFGFPVKRYARFRAEGERQRLAVRSLPVSGRPATFVNAIGSGFSIEVQASRTVVAVGDPIELTLRLRGDGPLTGVSLPPLSGPGALPETHFSVPDGSIAGRVDTESRSKLFTVTVRVLSSEAREIPAIEFSFFDPAAGAYRTVKSRPIALSVESAEIVTAVDVVAAAGAVVQPADGGPALGTEAGIAIMTGAELSLSKKEDTLVEPWGSGDIRPALAALHGVPALALVLAWLFNRSRGWRRRRSRIRRALRAVERALDSGGPAREAVPGVIAAMRRLGEEAGADRTAASVALAGLETLAFDPASADRPVAGDVVEELRRTARGWVRAPAGSVTVRSLAAAGLLIIAGAAPCAGQSTVLEEARALYAEALAENDRMERVRLFGQAEGAYRRLAGAHAHAAELQVDWGNAALGAQDTGRAVLAYRRALQLMPANGRARANLAWIRSRMPPWLPRPEASEAWESLLFWRNVLTAKQLHLIAGGAFALALLGLAAWVALRRRVFRALAVPALALWVAAGASALTTPSRSGDAVVLADGATLRSADNPGSAPAVGQPLPSGTEVTVLERRGSWVRVAMADGTVGWLVGGIVETVIARTTAVSAGRNGAE